MWRRCVCFACANTLIRVLCQAIRVYRSLKHLIPLKLQRIRGGKEAARAAGAPVQDNAAQFCCPVTGQEMNGRFPFVIMRHTGHVISRRALREVCVW